MQTGKFGMVEFSFTIQVTVGVNPVATTYVVCLFLV